MSTGYRDDIIFLIIGGAYLLVGASRSFGWNWSRYDALIMGILHILLALLLFAEVSYPAAQVMLSHVS